MALKGEYVTSLHSAESWIPTTATRSPMAWLGSHICHIREGSARWAVNCAMTVSFKVYVCVNSPSIRRKLLRTSRDQQPPISQERVPAAENIERRRLDM